MMSYGDRFTTDGPTYSLNTKFSPTDLDKSLESHLSPFQLFFFSFFFPSVSIYLSLLSARLFASSFARWSKLERKKRGKEIERAR